MGMDRRVRIAPSPERDSAGEPLSERRRQTRRRLMRAAAEVFSRKSVPAATVEDVLAEAGVSRRTFYQFFADKLDLLAALYANRIDFVHAERLKATAAATGGLDCLLRGFDVYSSVHAWGAPLVRALASEALRPESPLGPLREVLIDRTVELYCERFEALENRTLDPLLIRSLVLMSEALHLHMVRTTSATGADLERVRATIHRIVERAIAAE